MKKTFKIKAHTHATGNHGWAYLSDLYRSVSNGSFIALWDNESEALAFSRENPTDDDMKFLREITEGLDVQGQAWNVTLVECDENGNQLATN